MTAEPDWKPNPGYCPEDARGKRVRVKLANGNMPDPTPVTTTGHPGWAADGKERCRWSLTGSPFDIESYIVI